MKSLDKVLADYIEDNGVEALAQELLRNKNLEFALSHIIYKKVHDYFKKFVKTSILTSKKKNQDREYLFNLTPLILCQELQNNAAPYYESLVHGLLGISDINCVLGSQHLINTVALIISLAARLTNRQATGGLKIHASAHEGGVVFN